jgi:enoyl-[acyl-carrier-protein] reductase (NADH)
MVTGVIDMPTSLKGKIAVVTGVSHQGQIGETVARALAENGAALRFARGRRVMSKRALPNSAKPALGYLLWPPR